MYIDIYLFIYTIYKFSIFTDKCVIICPTKVVICCFKTVCPRSSDPFYIVSHCIKWVTTSWTYSIIAHARTLGNLPWKSGNLRDRTSKFIGNSNFLCLIRTRYWYANLNVDFDIISKFHICSHKSILWGGGAITGRGKYHDAVPDDRSSRKPNVPDGRI